MSVKRFFTYSFAFLAIASVGTICKADDASITIAADSSSGTYRKMLSEIINVCNSDSFNIVEAKGVSGGAPGNLDALVNNKAQAAFLHSDVYLANSMADSSYAKFQTLVALYPEPIHVIVPRKPVGGTLGFGSTALNSLSDAKGFSVGAAGGGLYTARFLNGQGEGGFKVETFNTGDEVIAALKEGKIAAAIFVGAAPLPNITALDKNTFKIVPIGESIESHVHSLYREVTVNYTGLTNGPVKTLAPVATLLTRKYSTPSKVEAQRHLRECFYEHLDELKDNGSPNWQQVESADHGVLPWYELPAPTATDTTSTSRKH